MKRRFTKEQRADIVYYANTNSVAKAVEKFSVTPTQIYVWRRKVQVVKYTGQNKQASKSIYTNKQTTVEKLKVSVDGEALFTFISNIYVRDAQMKATQIYNTLINKEQ